MEATFDDKAANPAQDQERRIDNAIKADKGEPQTGGAAGREQVASKDPAEYDNTTGGPGSQGGKPIQDPVI